MTLPTGPGVRVDSGITAGEVIGGNFDSMLAKLIVTGATREQALQRSSRALAEMQIGGLPTVLPFHRAVVVDPAFAPANGAAFTMHTRWIETEFNNTIPAFDLAGAAGAADDAGTRQSVTVEVGGKRLEVTLPSGFAVSSAASSGGAKKAKKAGRNRSAGPVAANGNALTSPMQGTIVKVAVADGDVVAEGDLIVVLEAMKMEQPLTAHKAGTVTGPQRRRRGHRLRRRSPGHHRGLARPSTAHRAKGSRRARPPVVELVETLLCATARGSSEPRPLRGRVMGGVS